MSYATQTDLSRLGVKSTATASLASNDLDAALAAASAFADSYLGNRYSLPLSAYGADVTLAVAKIAAWEIMSAQRGHSPENGADSIWKTRRDEAVAWLEKVASGDLTPSGCVDSTADVDELGTPTVTTTARRGW